jgi:hypothetical protein
MPANYKHPYQTSKPATKPAPTAAPKPVNVTPKVIGPMPVTPGNAKNTGM